MSTQDVRRNLFNWLVGAATVLAVVGMARWNRPVPIALGTAVRLPQIPAVPISIRGSESLGSKNARVAVIEYSDFQCPWCGVFSREIEPALFLEYVATGRVRWVFRHLPLTGVHQRALPAAVAAECAGEQSVFWKMHDKLFDNQSAFGTTTMSEFGKGVVSDYAQFARCLERGNSERITLDLASAAALGVDATPTFFVGRLGGDNVRVSSVLAAVKDKSEFERILNGLVAGTEAR